MAAKPTTEFEYEVCSRCGGEGRYSYNQMDGDRCYGCGGTGYKLTKRGAAAREFYLALVSKPATEIIAGDRVFLSGIGQGWYVVESVTVMENGMIDLNFVTSKGMSGARLRPSDTLRVAQAPEAKTAKLAQAIAFQSTLTKQGKPRK